VSARRTSASRVRRYDPPMSAEDALRADQDALIRDQAAVAGDLRRAVLRLLAKERPDLVAETPPGGNEDTEDTR
jgi:hypothetical protein